MSDLLALLYQNNDRRMTELKNDERTAKRISDARHRDRAARDAQLCRP
ncbi:hypothetical protein GGR46_004038 [Sphingomonas kyeonggiensis]|uniref:Uncharacterized protein n=1 Tax=Sphingomonas kyeonggiensis TaxID=1268553 RepID=A0A7W6JVT7_9SPHN|nr:hypothetical protein [Sphingomonas kyeonggiensis]